jgi:hypothetical protein
MQRACAQRPLAAQQPQSPWTPPPGGVEGEQIQMFLFDVRQGKTRRKRKKPNQIFQVFFIPFDIMIREERRGLSR